MSSRPLSGLAPQVEETTQEVPDILKSGKGKVAKDQAADRR